MLRRLPLMASDGCQAPTWKSEGAFPHLFHRPSQKTESYRTSTPAATSSAGAATGVWDGPAPRGSRSTATATADGATAAASTTAKQYLPLPGGGRLPLLGLGTYKTDSADSVRQAIELGYRHIDCAAVYQNQDKVGQGMRDFIQQGRRGELFIVSKVWNDEHQPDKVRASAEQTLKDLGCEYLDIMLMHWPLATKPGTMDKDSSVTLLQTWQAMEKLVQDGLTKHIGVSNFNLQQLTDLCKEASIKPVCNQIELHPQLAQRKLVGQSLRQGVYSVAYAPLGIPEGRVEGVGPSLKEKPILAVAEATGRSPAQVMLKWNAQRGVVVIPKAQTPANFQANFAGFFDWSLTEEQKGKLDEMDTHTRKVDPEWFNFDEETPVK